MHTTIRFLLLLLLSAPLAAIAQDSKPGDPFVKGKSEAKPPAKAAAGPAPVNPAAPPPAGPFELEPLATNMVFILETYTLAQEDLDAIHADTPGGPAFHERVRKLESEGKARLDSLMALPTRSGQRALLESIDEVIYPTEFDPPVPGRPLCSPSAWEMRPTGHRLELDPVLSTDESVVDINLAPEFTRLAGFVVHKTDELSPGQLQPLFSARVTRTSVSCPMNVPTLLGTSNRPAQTGIAEVDGVASMDVTFVIPRLSGPKVAPPAVEPPTDPGSTNIRMVYRFYSLPREKARDLLSTTADPDKLYDLVLALPEGERKLERLITMGTRSGQRATVEEIAENIYGTKTDPPRSEKVREKPSSPTTPAAANPGAVNSAQDPPIYENRELLPGRFTSFEMRPLGWRIEVDPVLEPDGRTVYLNLAPEHVEHRGNLRGHEMLARYPEQPVFATQKITTTVAALVGSQCFLGTMNAPHDTGVNDRKDDGRAWFGFVRVTLE